MFLYTFLDLVSLIYLAVNGTVISLPVFIKNILNCVLKTKECHGVSDKLIFFFFGVKYPFKSDTLQ